MNTTTQGEMVDRAHVHHFGRAKFEGQVSTSDLSGVQTHLKYELQRVRTTDLLGSQTLPAPSRRGSR